MNKITKVVATRSFEVALKKLKKDHKTKVLQELKDVINKLVNFEITTQKSNHNLTKAEGHKDIHLDGGNLILIYRYDVDDNILYISLRLQDKVDHKELKSYDKKKYSAPTHDFDIDTITSSQQFMRWYDSLPEESQWQIDSIADLENIPNYTEACASDLSYLKQKYIQSSSNQFDELEFLPQEYTSEKTSINTSKVPAIFKLVKTWKPGTINLDYGGGRFDIATDYLYDEYDVTNLIYDPFNRSSKHNSYVLTTLHNNGGADTATCSNVLNVIKEYDVRINVLENISKLLKPNGTLYITVYEGGKDQVEGPTGSGYQLARKTAEYLDEIKEVFPDATRKGKLIICHNI